MIGIDTNILLRAVLDDDARQSPVAKAFLAARTPDDPAVINSVVLAEFVWVLRRRYKTDPTEIASLLADIASAASIRILDGDAFIGALQDYRDGVAGFTDSLLARINGAAGCTSTVTFDEDAPSGAGFSVLG